jgi:hypothetical protein
MLILAAGAATAQDRAAEDARPPAPVEKTTPSESDLPPAPALQEVPLQVLLQPDKNGKLIPTPVFAPTEEGSLKQHVLSWNDIDQLLERSGDPQGPRLTCRQVNISGLVNGNRANLEIALTFLTSPQRWIRAPLGLSNAVVTQYEAPSGGFLELDDKDGLVLWLPPAPRVSPPMPDAEAPPEPDADGNEAMPMMMPSAQLVERTLTISASVAIRDDGAEKRLALRLPRAPSSRLDLVVDTPDAQANWSGSEAVASTRPEAGGATRITLEGVGGDFSLSWRPKRTVAVPPAPVLEVQGFIDVNLAENDALKCSARLTVQSLSEPFQSFLVTLPPGMRPAPVQAADYEIVPNELEAAKSNEARRQATVRLRQPTVGPVTVRIDATAVQVGQEGSFIEVGGFAVADAVKQSGRLVLTAVADQSISWVESPNIVQSNEGLPSSRRPEDVAAQFKYFAQPFSLLVRAAPQKTRVRVEPTYLIEVFPDYVKLTANLKYQIRGAKARFVRVDLQGWTLHEIGGDEVVNDDGDKYDQLAPLEIPFRTSLSGDVSVRLTAQRILEGSKGALRVPLPAPEADFLVSALVAVAPNENIELIPNSQQSHGLLPEPPTKLEPLDGAAKAAFFYRTRTGEPQPVFAADYEVKAGSVAVELDGEVRLEEQRAAIRQELTYTLAYEPANQLILEAPQEAFQRGDLRWFFDGAPLSPKPVAGGAEGRQRLRFQPPAPLGRHVVAVEYAVPLPEMAPEQTTALVLPLAVPVTEHNSGPALAVKSNALRVSSARPLHVAPDKSPWRSGTPRLAESAGAWQEIVFGADGAQPQLALLLTREQAEQPLGDRLDRLWLQSWLSGGRRRDRAAFPFMLREGPLRVRLPRGADPATLIVLVNGRRLADERISLERSSQAPRISRQTLVALDVGLESDGPVDVELWYGFLDQQPGTWRRTLEAPTFPDVGWVRHVFWQLVLPPNEHAATPPPGLTAEHVWRRRGWFWEREPALGQRELERWSGASEQAQPATSNSYLYSSFGAAPTLELYVVPRSAAVLGASGLVLLAGMGLLRRPPRRQRAWIAEIGLAGAVAVMIGVALSPETAVLIGQSAAFGAGCVALLWLLTKIGPAARRPPVVGSTASRSRDRNSTRTPVHAGPRSSYASAGTASPPVSTN